MRTLTIAVILILAVLAVIGGTAVNLPGWAIAALLLTLVGSGFLSILLLNLRTPPPTLQARNKAEEIAELQRLDQLASTTYHAIRALTRGPGETPHYYLELTDRRLLYLDGQYLEEYHSEFPCSEFDLLRHKEDGYIVGLRCRGKKIPIQRAESDTYAYPPQDGQIITDHTFAELKGPPQA